MSIYYDMINIECKIMSIIVALAKVEILFTFYYLKLI